MSAAQMIVRVYEGDEIPEGWSFTRLIAETIEPSGVGTGTFRVYIILVERR